MAKKGKRAYRACISRRLKGRSFRGKRAQRKALGRAARTCARRHF